MKERVIIRVLGVLTLLSGLALIVTLTGDVLTGNAKEWNMSYMAVQLLTCGVLMLDFCARLHYAKNRSRFW